MNKKYDYIETKNLLLDFEFLIRLLYPIMQEKVGPNQIYITLN